MRIVRYGPGCQLRRNIFDAGDWMPTGTACDSPEEARRKQQHRAGRYPGLATAIVRESRTFAIEEQR